MEPNESNEDNMDKQSKLGSSISDLKSHWDEIYETTKSHQLGWYLAYPKLSLQLIEKLNLDKNASILDVGSGTSKLIKELLELNYVDITVNDISSIALQKSRESLGPDKASKVKWIIDDVLNPAILNTIKKVDLWHDKAVLHFFTTVLEQNRYFKLLKKLVKPQGYAIIAVFNTSGVKKCSDLSVHRYNHDMLQDKMEPEFKLIEHFDVDHLTPSFKFRPYIYTVFQRNI